MNFSLNDCQQDYEQRNETQPSPSIPFPKKPCWLLNVLFLIK